MKQQLMALYRAQLRASRYQTARRILLLLCFGLQLIERDIETFQALSTVPGLLTQDDISRYFSTDRCWVLLP